MLNYYVTFLSFCAQEAVPFSPGSPYEGNTVRSFGTSAREDGCRRAELWRGEHLHIDERPAGAAVEQCCRCRCSRGRDPAPPRLPGRLRGVTSTHRHPAAPPGFPPRNHPLLPGQAAARSRGGGATRRGSWRRQMPHDLWRPRADARSAAYENDFHPCSPPIYYSFYGARTVGAGRVYRCIVRRPAGALCSQAVDRVRPRPPSGCILLAQYPARAPRPPACDFPARPVTFPALRLP